MRRDGVRLKKMDSMRTIMLHVFKDRNASIIYSSEEIKFDSAMKYLRELNKDREDKISTFHLVNAALVRTISKYPELNRFVASNKLYARKELSVSFVTLKKVQGEDVESIAKIYYELNDDIFQVATKVDEGINICRENKEKDDDKLLEYFAKLPSPVIGVSAKAFEIFCSKGLMSKKVHNSIPLFTSVFISNLGSIGHDALYHHLYEFGTCSVFVTLGKKVRKENATYLNLCFSVDERIADGVVLVKAFRYFKTLMEHPERLELKPDEIKKDPWLK